MILVTATMFMEILDGSIITTALPAMAHSFGTPVLRLNIGISAYALAVGVFVPASGWVVDRLGARRVLTMAILLFTLSSVACGLTSGLVQFVVMRVVQGVAGAMMVPVGRLVILRETPKDRLVATMQSLVWPALVAPVLGPPVGGFITASFGWRWIFYLNAPLGLIGLVMALLVIPDMRGPCDRPFDWAGFLLIGLGTFGLLSGLDRLSAAPDLLAALLVLLGVAVSAAAIGHLRRTPAPLLNLAPTRIATFRMAAQGGLASRISIHSVPFLLPLMFQVGFGWSPTRSGLLVLMVFAGNLAMKLVAQPTLRHFGYRNVLIWNSVVCAACLALCAAIGPQTPLWVTGGILFAGGLSRSLQFTTLSTIAFADVPKPVMADANGLFNTIGQITMAVAITAAALTVRAAHALGVPATGPTAYHTAFLVAAVAALGTVLDALRLSPSAGQSVLRRPA